MLAQRFPQAKVEAVEVLSEAFKEAKENFNASNWAPRLEVFHQSIQEFKPTEPYDLVVCNPPFFSGSLKSPRNEKNTAKHEVTLSQPELALAIGRVLKEDGLAFVLYPEPEMKQFVREAASTGLFLRNMLFVRHEYGGRIFRQIGAFEKRVGSITEDQLVIREGTGYSKEFIGLMKEYYLDQ